MDMKNFFALGFTAGITGAANAIVTVASSVATHSGSNSHQVQKAVEFATNPATINFAQNKPFLILGAMVVALGVGVATIFSMAIENPRKLKNELSDDLNDKKENNKDLALGQSSDLVSDKISSLREKFMPNSNKDNTLKM